MTLCVSIKHKSGFICASDCCVTDGDSLIKVTSKAKRYEDKILMWAGESFAPPESFDEKVLTELTSEEKEVIFLVVEKRTHSIIASGQVYKIRESVSAIGSGAAAFLPLFDFFEKKIKNSTREEATQIIKKIMEVAAARSRGCEPPIIFY